MQITFQNKREDLKHFYHYMVKETEEAKKISRQVIQNWLKWAILVSLLFGSWLAEEWLTGVGLSFFIFLVIGFIGLMIVRFDPVYYAGIQLFSSQEREITNKDLQFLQLPRIITVDDDWLEIRSSEALHRWRWSRVERIAVRSNFIFIHVGNCPVVYVPKRDFSSEQSFKEFGERLFELRDNNINRVVASS